MITLTFFCSFSLVQRISLEKDHSVLGVCSLRPSAPLILSEPAFTLKRAELRSGRYGPSVEEASGCRWTECSGTPEGLIACVGCA